jgi:hypothetical protein
MGFIEARRTAQGNSFRRAELFDWLPEFPGIFPARCNFFAAFTVLVNKGSRETVLNQRPRQFDF